MRKLTALIMATALLAGCLGQTGIQKNSNTWNFERIEKRWSHGGPFLGFHLMPARPITELLDLLMFNSIEFWRHDNPITGKEPARIDMPAENFHYLQDYGVDNISAIELRFHRDNTVEMAITSTEGLEEVLSAIATDRSYQIYRGELLLAAIPLPELTGAQPLRLTDPITKHTRMRHAFQQTPIKARNTRPVQTNTMTNLSPRARNFYGRGTWAHK